MRSLGLDILQQQNVPDKLVVFTFNLHLLARHAVPVITAVNRLNGGNMADYIYDENGIAVGVIRSKYIHDMNGSAIGQIKGTHVHKLSGEYVGELYKHKVVDKHMGNFDNPGNTGSPGNPGNRGAENYGYPDVFHELLSYA